PHRNCARSHTRTTVIWKPFVRAASNATQKRATNQREISRLIWSAGLRGFQSSHGQSPHLLGCGVGRVATPSLSQQGLPVSFWVRLRSGYFTANSSGYPGSIRREKVLRSCHSSILARQKIRNTFATASAKKSFTR